ncbi:sulfatase [Rhodopirellula islandica]|uniref:Sulfatase n=1 Tax=Rhodopirellula islandica TaxID=595434 RepID=A0A0J1BJK6_RHOIS|nr:arylsulfatase [Rhodopirellula islandica]KLU06740.1 sulfatase [Rhodopirellula islandica]
MVDLDCNCPHTIPIISHSMHHRIWILLAACLTTCSPAWAQTSSESRPNVILVVTDDQGYGDMSCHGNPWLNTLNLDRLATQSVRLENFHVDPVCTPTRAALMTGRYCTRVGAWAVTEGRQLLDPDETTMAEIFRDSGYRTGMFGKWHLGDPPPFAPRERGFETVVRHMAGGADEIGNPTGNDYFDDTYYRNGTPESFDGYCTDIWFEEAIDFIQQDSEQPFFVYIPTNAMHSPYLVADRYSDPFEQQGIEPKRAAFYGMIQNFDENLGRLLKKLDQANLRENTLLIFMSDNGTAQGASEQDRKDGFNAGMRGKKGSVYEGGHRVPCFASWPAKWDGNRPVHQLTCHRDWLPTLIDLCDLKRPAEVSFDGRSMAGLLHSSSQQWPERTLIIERQSDNVVSATKTQGRAQPPFAVLTDRWRLIRDELYDIRNDPGQFKNIAAEHPEVVRELRAAYDTYFEDVHGSRKDVIRFIVGKDTTPTLITVRDWHPTEGGVIWKPSQLPDSDLLINGFWEIEVAEAGRYAIKLQRFPEDALAAIEADQARLRVDSIEQTQTLKPEESSVTFEIDLPAGPHRLQTWLRDAASQKIRGAYFVEFTKVGPSEASSRR